MQGSASGECKRGGEGELRTCPQGTPQAFERERKRKKGGRGKKRPIVSHVVGVEKGGKGKNSGLKPKRRDGNVGTRPAAKESYECLHQRRGIVSLVKERRGRGKTPYAST